jgi:cyclic pyranopterin phosphate synthase
MISSDEIIEMIPGLIQTDDGSNTARVFKLRDSMGTVGFISPLSCKFCGSCNRIRMTASGTIKPCLHSDNEISIKEYLNNEIMLTSALKDIIYNKPAEHHLDVDKKSMSHRMMYQIGG